MYYLEIFSSFMVPYYSRKEYLIGPLYFILGKRGHKGPHLRTCVDRPVRMVVNSNFLLLLLRKSAIFATLFHVQVIQTLYSLLSVRC